MTPDEARKVLLARCEALAADETANADSRAAVALKQVNVVRPSRTYAVQHRAMAQAQDRRYALWESCVAAALARLDPGEWGWCVRCREALA
ncbi:TraR/DksA family transcriptional regulator [Altererythrobacter sp. GH1-8]|uniref:TraR/DksA family transcriptional regulator n=1 Tax=Altererythrobacter sp. GH1-8 TaxID=3349333 RepID=UPI00374D9288